VSREPVRGARNLSPSQGLAVVPHHHEDRAVVASYRGNQSTNGFALTSSTRSIVGIEVLAAECGWGCRPTMAPPFGASAAARFSLWVEDDAIATEQKINGQD
jgi:hypothetical protein